MEFATQAHNSDRSRVLVIFDKDGTLIDFNLMWGSWIETLAWNLELRSGLGTGDVREAVFEELGYDLNTRKVRPLGALCCNPMHALFPIVSGVLVSLGLKEDEAFEVTEESWAIASMDPAEVSRPLADLPAVFNELHLLGCAVAVCTADDRGPTLATLRKLGVENDVDAVMCADDGLPPKPAPDQLWSLCGRLNCSPHRVVMVGDTPTDMRMGRQAGVALNVGVLDGAGAKVDLAVDADLLVPSVAKLPKLVAPLCAAPL
jgi:phosphoglycolate phosphatase-like HAD superfamily hydrolase